jgi:hypothetical protein
MKKFILFANAIALVGFISSCGNSAEKSETNNADNTPVVKDTTASKTSGQPEEYYQVPAPDEMFGFMKDLGGEGKSTTYLNSPDNAKNYVDTKSKALNFGIYATDFLYCSTFDFGAEGLKYFVNVKKLGDDLGISGVINQSMADRIKNNIGKNDSLTDLSNSLYFSSIAALENGDKASTLALVITGGWIESVYLVTNMAKKFKADDPAIGRVAEQKYTLENLLGYLGKYKTDENVAAVTAQLNELKSVFDQLKEETTNGAVSAKGGKKVLGGGTKIIITEAQYKAITEKIKSIHDSFTMTK